MEECATDKVESNSRHLQPLLGVRVLDFSTLLPGPLATLILARAGASVLKVERANGGDEMRSYSPKFGDFSANFALLNQGKKSVAVDLKNPRDTSRIVSLVKKADVLVEQFRPGVMERLGLGYGAMKEVNPRLIYCSLSGYGQQGPRAQFAGHDLNYVAEMGLLGLTIDEKGVPGLPPVLIADIVGGAYPAVMNILLALRLRESTGNGSYLDISMSKNLIPLIYWALANAGATGEWPSPGGELVTGGSPRYHLYRTADGTFLAVAALEDRFWNRFCELIDLPEGLRDDSKDSLATQNGVAARLMVYDAKYWESRFDGEDVCVSRLRTLEEATTDPHYSSDLDRLQRLVGGGIEMAALPLPIVGSWDSGECDMAPRLGADNDLLDETSLW